MDPLLYATEMGNISTADFRSGATYPLSPQELSGALMHYRPCSVGVALIASRDGFQW